MTLRRAGPGLSGGPVEPAPRDLRHDPGVLVAFSITPATGDDQGGVAEAVAEAVRVVRASGLPCETNAMFTNVEGNWDEVMDVVRQAVEAVAARSPRVSLVLKADVRPGRTGQLAAKVQRVEALLDGGTGAAGGR